MEKHIETICASLDSLSAATLNAWSDNRLLSEVWANTPPLSRHDLANIPKDLSERLKKADIETLDGDMVIRVKDIPRRIQLLQASIVPNLYNGHGGQTAPAYVATFTVFEKLLSPLFSWETIDTKTMPSQIAKRLRAVRAEVDELAPEKEALAAKISLIEEATAAADSLPTDLQALKEAREKVNAHAVRSTELCALIEAKEKEAAKFTEHMKQSRDETQRLVSQCEEAYRITTTKGLAAAFDQRAGSLQKSMWLWLGGLVVALMAAAYLGAKRVDLLNSAISTAEPQWRVISMHVLLSTLSVGMPLWFAWLATKQVGHRFRLTEDYAFKASVAKAYEGYRKEAARIDKSLESRLFASALSRLEEPPLRLVDDENHGSPWHEMFQSEAFQKALAVVPELKDQFLKIGRGKNLPKETGGLSNTQSS